MSLPISLYDPMVLIEAAATLLTGCYIAKLAFFEKLTVLESGIRRSRPRTIGVRMIGSRVIGPALPPQSSAPVLSALPLRKLPSQIKPIRPLLAQTRWVAESPVAESPAAENSVGKSPAAANSEASKIVSICTGKKVPSKMSHSNMVPVGHPTTTNGAIQVKKIQQTDWLQRA